MNITWQTISGAILLGGVAFSVYRSYHVPQEKSGIVDAVYGERIKAIQESLKTILENHLPHFDARLIAMQQQVSEMDKNITKLSTIIEERIQR